MSMHTLVWMGLLIVSAVLSSAAGARPSQCPGIPWPAVDALGRALPTSQEVGPPRADRFVGIFYFLWHNENGGKSPNWDGPYDIARILAADPAALSNPKSPLWGPIGMFHYWGEPRYGYYHSDDEWVLRRHAHLLADAGIDTLIFDTTNAVTYAPVYRKLCQVFEEVRKEGGRTPQIAFMVNTKAGETAARIYEDLYKPGLYRDLWFQWQGKPLMICDPAAASTELQSFFTLRRAHWPFSMVNTKDAWHWEATYPQPYGFTDDPGKAEMVNVSVAQNLRVSDGQVTNMSAGNARGRSFHDGAVDTSAGAVNRGLNFQEQWKRAFELDPPFVMVTGWNEWIAGRWGNPNDPLMFVDQFDEEHSRDIEPMVGGHGDNYYYQLVANVRRYKGAPSLPKPSAPKVIRVSDGFEQWKDVLPEYVPAVGNTLPRDGAGAAGLHYVNRTGRNEFTLLKVARDTRSISFYARTRIPITPATDPGWMWLLINVDGGDRTGWEGFDYIVNRTVDPDGTAWLERNTGGWTWKKVAPVQYHVEGCELQLSIPRAALGLPRDDGPMCLDFRWMDNVSKPGDPLDPYVHGDAAPEGRFRYRYQVP